MATHSSTLALKIPWTEELGAGYYPWGHKESGMTERLHFTSLHLLLIDNVVLVSGVQQNDSVIHVCILFQILFPYRLFQSIEYSSLCYSRSLLIILYIVMCIC